MNWTIKKTPRIPREMESLGLNPITLELLVQRGFFSKKEVEKFLNTRYEDLHSPANLSGIKEAVSRIGTALEKEQAITIYGDYDADGITSTTLLKEALESLGMEISTYIPDRNKEGYGLNFEALDYIHKNYSTDLLITVDCGTSNWEEIEYAQKLGMDTIVVDHHAIPKKTPKNCILINPKLPAQSYPFRDLAGVGVVFQLVRSIWDEFLPEKREQLKWFLDLVAIGTIADCVPIIDENRVFAKFGLIVLQKTKRLGLLEIIKTARLNIGEKNPPSAENIAFQIGPRLNAAGRMDHADLTLNLLAEKNPVKARVAALELEAKNSERQKVTQEIYTEVKATLSDDEDYKLIIRSGEHWPLGIVGIVAGKIADEYMCPTFILRKKKDIIEGSARSIDGFNLIDAVDSCNKILEKYGGHSQALGIKIKPEKLGEFERKLLNLIERRRDEEIWGKKIHADVKIKAEDIDWDLISEIRRFEPFGEGNEEPIFVTEDMKIEEINLVGNGKKHTKFLLRSTNSQNRDFEAIYFKSAQKTNGIKQGDKVTVIYNLRANEWNGNHKIEMNVISLCKK